MGVVCPGYLSRHDPASLESTAKQNCDMLRGPNYVVMQVQYASLSTADRTLLTGRGRCQEHRKTREGLLQKEKCHQFSSSDRLKPQAGLH